jgi:hypothetical protein
MKLQGGRGRERASARARERQTERRRRRNVLIFSKEQKKNSVHVYKASTQEHMHGSMSSRLSSLLNLCPVITFRFLITLTLTHTLSLSLTHTHLGAIWQRSCAVHFNDVALFHLRSDEKIMQPAMHFLYLQVRFTFSDICLLLLVGCSLLSEPFFRYPAKWCVIKSLSRWIHLIILLISDHASGYNTHNTA